MIEACFPPGLPASSASLSIGWSSFSTQTVEIFFVGISHCKYAWRPALANKIDIVSSSNNPYTHCTATLTAAIMSDDVIEIPDSPDVIEISDSPSVYASHGASSSTTHVTVRMIPLTRIVIFTLTCHPLPPNPDFS